MGAYKTSEILDALQEWEFRNAKPGRGFDLVIPTTSGIAAKLEAWLGSVKSE